MQPIFAVLSRSVGRFESPAMFLGQVRGGAQQRTLCHLTGCVLTSQAAARGLTTCPTPPRVQDSPG